MWVRRQLGSHLFVSRVGAQHYCNQNIPPCQRPHLSPAVPSLSLSPPLSTFTPVRAAASSRNTTDGLFQLLRFLFLRIIILPLLSLGNITRTQTASQRLFTPGRVRVGHHPRDTGHTRVRRSSHGASAPTPHRRAHLPTGALLRPAVRSTMPLAIGRRRRHPGHAGAFYVPLPHAEAPAVWGDRRSFCLYSRFPCRYWCQGM